MLFKQYRSMVMRSPSAYDALDPPLWKVLKIKLSFSHPLLDPPPCHGLGYDRLSACAELTDDRRYISEKYSGKF